MCGGVYFFKFLFRKKKFLLLILSLLFSTAGNYFGPHLSAALHKAIMRPCQADVGFSCLRSTWNSLGSLGAGEGNSSLLHRDAFELCPTGGKPANELWVPHISEEFVSLTFPMSRNSTIPWHVTHTEGFLCCSPLFRPRCFQEMCLGARATVSGKDCVSVPH